ncbi:hypothetical protein HYH02_008283 [Chlamydomonas schloesseri]|uniref:Importin N-terminal domain-containing protein n=1 Tax=Chlamydomonas schloesseri TaxID=2026947 RepID=A0A836B3M0_9CHLO|nr:hypothetical protein HYH02_008283 [Chlamydomonas schloesseri]|eukprot:KAG2446721.1 hypothetical protein HYH02_008283 [Chlamydomonas schloesseri]
MGLGAPGGPMMGPPPHAHPTVPEPTSVEQILATIQGALSVDKATRSAAEGLLHGWEADAAPGFLSGLMRIVEQRDSVPEPIRLLAVVVAKNAVGSSWRKTLGTREWSRVPDEEKAVVREGAVQLLLADPSERVALQLSLLITNIARFDFPGRSENLLQLLLSAAGYDAQLAPAVKLRALKALKRVLQGLGSKRFVIEAPQQAAGAPLALPDLSSLSQRITAERELFKTRLSDCFAPLHGLLTQHAAAFIAAAPGWEVSGPFAAAAAACLQALLYLIPSPTPDELAPGTQGVLEAIHTVCTTVQRGPPASLGAASSAAGEQWTDTGGKLYERLAALAIAYLDTNPLPFAEFVPFFLELFVQSALIGLDAATVRAMRPKRRVLLVRFISKALLNPFYRQEWVESPLPPHLPPQRLQHLMEARARAARAHAALSGLLTGATCAQLVEALVAKYVALSGEELEEWRDDPESYARTMEVESGPDADTPRPIGVGLLLCMLEHGGEAVAVVLLGLASALQQRQTTPDALLMREACYRCIGEGFNHVSSHINFEAWYNAELAPLLTSNAPLPPPPGASAPPPPSPLGGGKIGPPGSEQVLLASVLAARALWLLGVCGGELPAAALGGAYQLCVCYLAAEDVVVALSSVTSLLGLLSLVLDDQAALEQLRAQQRAAQGRGAGAAGGLAGRVDAMQLAEGAAAAGDQQENAGAIAEANARVESRLAALSNEVTAAALLNCFGLLSRLREVESMVRVLQLVSVLVEALGERIRPHLGIIAAGLPQVWSRAEMLSAAAASAAEATSLLDRDAARRRASDAAGPSTPGAGGAATPGGAAGAAAGTPGSAAAGRGRPGALAAARGAAADSGGGMGHEAGAVVRLHSALIAVLTHLVGKLRAVALEDPNICGVVFPLLKYSTRVGTPEGEVLVDEAFRLWSVTIASLPSVPPQLRELLPNAAALLRRGRDHAALLPLLEAYLLLDAADSLQPLAADMGRALEASISNTATAVLAAVGAPGTGPGGAAGGGAPGSTPAAPGGAGGAAAVQIPLSAETPAEAMSAAALIDVLLQLFPPGGSAAASPAQHGPVVQLVAPALRSMAALLAHPAVPSAGLNVKIINIFEGFLEVLGRLWLLSPMTFPELVAGLDAAQAAAAAAVAAQQAANGGAGGGAGTGAGAVEGGAVERLLDRWLTIAAARFLEEVVGVKTMSMLGRFRRRMATMSLASLLRAGVCEQLFEPRKVLRVCSLAVQALADDSEFAADQSELDSLDFAADLAQDTVLARRLAITRADPVRKVDVHECVRGLLAKLSERAGGPDAFLAALAAHGAPERLRLQLAAVITGQRLGAGGIIDGEEPEDSADPADDDELYGLAPPGLSEGGVGFVSSGSTPE